MYNPNMASNTAPRKRKMTSGQILPDGTKIYYEKAGNGDHVVLLIPGALGSTRSDFKPQLEKMNGEKFTIIGWDPRGYGRSRPPDKIFTPNFLREDANDAIALMEALGYPSYSLLGWSDGANVAAMMAANWSDRIRKLVMWGGNSYIPFDDLPFYKQARDVNIWSADIRQRMEDVYGAETFEKLWHAYVDTYIQMIEKSSGDVDLYMKDLEKIKCDTLIIHGEQDEYVPKVQAEHLHKNITGSRLVCWEDGVHDLHIQFADRFVALVEDFLHETNQADQST